MKDRTTSSRSAAGNFSSPLAFQRAALGQTQPGVVAPEPLQYRDLETITGWTERHIRRLMRRGEFPLPTVIGRRRKLGWAVEVVEAWTNAREGA